MAPGEGPWRPPELPRAGANVQLKRKLPSRSQLRSIIFSLHHSLVPEATGTWPGSRVREKEGLALSRCPRHARGGDLCKSPGSAIHPVFFVCPLLPQKIILMGPTWEDSGPGLTQPETSGSQSHTGHILGSHIETRSETGPKGMQPKQPGAESV